MPNSWRKSIKKFLHFKFFYILKCKIRNVRVQQHNLYMIWIIRSMYREIFCRIASMFCWERTLLVSFLSKLCPETLKQELRLPSYVTKQKIHNIWNISKKQPTTYCLHFCLELKLYSSMHMYSIFHDISLYL